MKLVPLKDRVVIKPFARETKTKGGILIAESAVEKPFSGEVVSLGQFSRMPDGKITAFPFDVGTKVVYRKGAGTEIPVDGENYLVMHEDEIVCLLED